MVSNLTLGDDVLAAWNDVKCSKAKYIICKLDGTSVQLENKGDNDATFEQFTDQMPMDDPRYAVYNLTWTADDGRKLSKIFFINYVPDGCKVMAAKFSYAQNKEAFKSNINPINKELQINDRLDFNEDEWKSNF